MSVRAARVFGGAHFATALLVGWGIYGCLPARWAPIDAVAGILIALEALSGAGLALGTSWARAAARVTSIVALVTGLGLVTLLAVTASWLSGVYGPVGAGGAAILALVAALALPYLVVLPAVELVWLGPRETSPER
jgi:hypothetical protein